MRRPFLTLLGTACALLLGVHCLGGLPLGGGGGAAAAPEATTVTGWPEDSGRGFLFHASFDGQAEAEVAEGAAAPILGEYPPRRKWQRARFVEGAFGKGHQLLHPRVLQHDALGNLDPERGTLAFFVRTKGVPYDTNLLRIETVGPFKFPTFMRFQKTDGGGLTVGIADETYLLQNRLLKLPSGTRLEEGRWHHLAVAWDQAFGARLYFDGREVDSSWGETRWNAIHADLDQIHRHTSGGKQPPGTGVAMDEIYVFDRPLEPDQVRALARKNEVPRQAELPPLRFERAHRENRLRGLSWEGKDWSGPVLLLGEEGLGANALAQVLPAEAQDVKRVGTQAIDGKYDETWPMPAGKTYRFEGRNGLHVRLDESWDYLAIAGDFKGAIYDENVLLESEAEGAPVRKESGSSYLSRWRLDAPRRGWLSFFMRDFGERRIANLSFFKLGSHEDWSEADRERFYVGEAGLESGARILGDAFGDRAWPGGVEFTGRYSPGDRLAFPLRGSPPDSAGGQRIEGLRRVHLFLPSADEPRGLRGLRLHLLLRGQLDGNRMKVEMHDAALPGRRIVSADFRLERAPNEKGATRLDLTFDTLDRVIPAGKPIWLTLTFRDDVDLLWTGDEEGSAVEGFFGPPEDATAEFVESEKQFLRMRFSVLSEARPWLFAEDPEDLLGRHNRRALELFTAMERVRRAAPEDPDLEALWWWTHKEKKATGAVEPKPVEGFEEAPRWALLQRELVEESRDVLEWWHDHRMVPNGALGNSWNDDTDFVQNVPKLALLGSRDGKVGDLLRKVSEGLLDEDQMEEGLNIRTMDALHAYEEGFNVLAPRALLDYGDPVAVERAMEAARAVRDKYMARGEEGRLRFRSGWMGREGVREKGRYAYDWSDNGFFLHPAAFLVYYGRHPAALSMLKGWVDGWLRLFERAERLPGYEKRKPYPEKVLPDGRVLSWRSLPRERGFLSYLPALYEVTGDERYLSVHEPFIRSTSHPESYRGLSPLFEHAMERPELAKKLAEMGREIELEHPATDHLGTFARIAYLPFEVAGEEDAARRALEAGVRKMRLMKRAYTWGEPYTDRIWLPDHPAIVMAQGGMSHQRAQLWPRHYVSYEGFSDLAAWVREKSPTRLEIHLFSFAAEEEEGHLRVWKTPLGRYRVRLDAGENGDGKAEGGRDREQVLHRSAQIPLSLEPGVPYVLRVELEERMDEDFWSRPDLALSPRDVAFRNDRIAVTVHNLGNSAVSRASVRLVDAAGATLAEQALPRKLEAPLDLRPRTVEVELPRKEGAARVVVDPDDSVKELVEFNNAAPVPGR